MKLWLAEVDISLSVAARMRALMKCMYSVRSVGESSSSFVVSWLFEDFFICVGVGKEMTCVEFAAVLVAAFVERREHHGTA